MSSYLGLKSQPHCDPATVPLPTPSDLGSHQPLDFNQMEQRANMSAACYVSHIVLHVLILISSFIPHSRQFCEEIPITNPVFYL